MYRVTSRSANHAMNVFASSGVGGRSVTSEPRRIGPNIDPSIASRRGCARAATLDAQLAELLRGQTTHGLEDRLVAPPVPDVELRADTREVHAKCVRRHTEALRELVAVDLLAFAMQQREPAHDVELAPRQA